MNPTITHEVTKAIRDTRLPLSEEEFDSVVSQAIQAGADRIATAEAGKLLLADYPYLSVTLVIGEADVPRFSNEPLRHAAIVSFVSRMGETPVTHTAAYYNGNIVQTNTVFKELHSAELWEFVKVMADKCESRESVAAIERLWSESRSKIATAVLRVPEGMSDYVLEGRGTAVQAANEKNFPAMMELTGGDRRKQEMINACSCACDGVMGESERRLVKLSNEMPMMMQEAKSYALHSVEELLKPFRDRQNTVMSGWASW